MQSANGPVTEEIRKEAFRVLVEAQDGEMTVTQSRELVSRQFNLTDQQVRQIEREGLAAQWPPL